MKCHRRPITDLNVFYFRADFDHGARCLGARNVGQRPAVMPAPVKTRAIIEIEEVYARGCDLDQDLVRVGPRIGQFFVAEDFRSAEFMTRTAFIGRIVAQLSRIAMTRAGADSVFHLTGRAMT